MEIDADINQLRGEITAMQYAIRELIRRSPADVQGVSSATALHLHVEHLIAAALPRRLSDEFVVGLEGARDRMLFGTSAVPPEDVG